jgi:chaperone required for assembly of F1-ATPase
MKRFYKAVTTTEHPTGHGIALDSRPVKTPARLPLLVPTAQLAQAIADEWQAQEQEIRPETMPLTGLANAAIDRIAPDTATFAAGLAAFAESELLAYRAEFPDDLVARQAAVWDPLLAWARQRYDVAFTVTTGILHKPQPAATLARMLAAFAAYDPFRLAALNHAVTISGSAVIGLALAESHIDADQAWHAGQLDELWQTEKWGRDPLVEAGWADKRKSLDAAERLLRLL